MSAWLFALVCLFHSEACPGGTVVSPAPLEIYVTADPAQPLAPVEAMKRELLPLLHGAGYQPVWHDPNRREAIGSASRLMVLELRGVCGFPPGAEALEPAVGSGVRLAETVVSPQGVTPFSWVNCANLTRMIGPALSSAPGAQREYLYGRAMARVVAHELYHVLMGTPEHGRGGIAKADFSVADLLDEVVRFDAAELAQLRQRAIQTETGDPAVGR